jgi:hypothetical protein
MIDHIFRYRTLLSLFENHTDPGDREVVAWRNIGSGGIIPLVGGWPTPLKNMSSSVGMMTFPIYMESHKIPWFQTTRAYIFIPENLSHLPEDNWYIWLLTFTKPVKPWDAQHWCAALCQPRASSLGDSSMNREHKGRSWENHGDTMWFEWKIQRNNAYIHTYIY